MQIWQMSVQLNWWQSQIWHQLNMNTQRWCGWKQTKPLTWTVDHRRQRDFLFLLFVYVQHIHHILHISTTLRNFWCNWNYYLNLFNLLCSALSAVYNTYKARAQRATEHDAAALWKHASDGGHRTFFHDGGRCGDSSYLCTRGENTKAYHTNKYRWICTILTTAPIFTT